MAKWALGAVAVIAAWVFALVMYERQKGPVAEAPAEGPRTVAPPQEVTAEALGRAYSANEIAADERYRGRVFRVIGMVVSVGRDLTGDPHVVIDGGPLPVLCSLASTAGASALRPGELVTVTGRAAGMPVASVLIDDCKIAGSE